MVIINLRLSYSFNFNFFVIHEIIYQESYKGIISIHKQFQNFYLVEGLVN